ncbi:MAG: hypothetical protein RI958_396 [Actinomycetota bacterium]
MSYRGRRPTGIQRVELELARELVGDPQVRLVRYDRDADCLRHVTTDELHSRYAWLNTTIEEPTHHASRQQAEPESRRRRQLARSARWGDTARALIGLRDGVRQCAASSLQLTRAAARALSRPRSRSASCASASWAPGDVLCSLSLWGSTRIAEYFAEVAGRRSVRVALAVHDLVPVVRPQYRAVSVEQDRVLFRIILDMADVVMSFSSVTHSDIDRFCRSEQIEVPSCRTMSAASPVLAATPVRPPSAAGLGEFVLCVSTIEIRKNHHLLFDVWESLIAERPAGAVPTLVLAGTVGWLNAETMHRLGETPGFEQHVVFIESPSDHELSWLYRNCCFTVYPSLYEGWGLPITESLDAGKVCITSNVSTMPEASEGFGVLVDPTDRRGWKHEIVRLVDDRAARDELEGQIRAGHRVRDASDLARSVRLVLDELVARP